MFNTRQAYGYVNVNLGQMSGLAQIAKPVVRRTLDVQRKRNGRALVKAQAQAQAGQSPSLQALVERNKAARLQREAEREAALTIVCSNGRTIRPIK